MIPHGRPRFEVVAGASAADRRLVPVDMIRALTGIDDAVSDEALGLLIDAALAQCATSCNLATWRGLPTTLAQEAVRATWDRSCWWWDGPRYAWDQPATLLLPWRAPITAVTITEGATELVENTDYRLLGAGVVERLDGWWSTDGVLVVDYVAGFVPLVAEPSYQPEGATLPADVVAMLADQVRLRQDALGMNLNLRSEDIPGIWSGAYNVAGGDTIDTSGLLRPLWDALGPYRAPPKVA